MNRNVLLFVFIGLTASFLVVYFHLQVKPSRGVAPKPIINSSVSTIDIEAPAVASAQPVGKILLAQTEQVSNAAMVAETAITNNEEAPMKKSMAQDKYAALRDLRAWAARDPEGALAAVMTLPEGDERNEALSAVCFGLAQTDPANAVKVAEELHLDKPPAAVMEDLVQQWASTDLNSSLTWAADQPAGAPRDEFMTRIAFTMSQADPSDAANLVMNQIPAGPARDEAVMTVLHQWANQNFAAAATWAKGVTGPLQERVLSELNGILDYRRALAQQ